ncbi:hypothetical protein FB639_002114 [Coemansia asiatica]|nr:hypothetical protein FB639_002114 [Coemansia asiatica]
MQRGFLNKGKPGADGSDKVKVGEMDSKNIGRVASSSEDAAAAANKVVGFAMDSTRKRQAKSPLVDSHPQAQPEDVPPGMVMVDASQTISDLVSAHRVLRTRLDDTEKQLYKTQEALESLTGWAAKEQQPAPSPAPNTAQDPVLAGDGGMEMDAEVTADSTEQSSTEPPRPRLYSEAVATRNEGIAQPAEAVMQDPRPSNEASRNASIKQPEKFSSPFRLTEIRVTKIKFVSKVETAFVVTHRYKECFLHQCAAAKLSAWVDGSKPTAKPRTENIVGDR